MRNPLRVVLPLLLAATISGCDLEFVDVEVGRPARFTAIVFADGDSIMVSAALYPGVDESHRVRNVVHELLIDGKAYEPEVRTTDGQRWRFWLPNPAAARGYLRFTPPGIGGLAAPGEIVIPIPFHAGSGEIHSEPGQPIELRVEFAPVPPDAESEIRIMDANNRPIYVARTQNFPLGPIYIPHDAIPDASPGPHSALMFLGARWLDEPNEGKYQVSVSLRGILAWAVYRDQAPLPDLSRSDVIPDD